MEKKEDGEGRGEEGGSRTDAMWMWRRRGAREEEAETVSVVRAWSREVLCSHQSKKAYQAKAPPDSFSLSCSLGTDTHKSRQRKRERAQDRDMGTYMGSQSERYTDGKRSS